MINYQAAQDILIAQARSFGKERISLDTCYGRVLSEKIMADRDYPPFDRSSVDGYAVRYGDLQQGIRRFDIVDTIYAGSASAIPIRSGECHKIMTGAPVPQDADAVIKREDTKESLRTVDILSIPARPFINISRRGEDMRQGDPAIEDSCLCEPALIGMLATLGKSELLVEKLPRTALFTTGNEVVQVDSAPGPSQIRNSNRWLLQAFLKKWGIRPSAYAHIPDDREATRSILSTVSADLIILSGGVSAGDADHVPAVLEELGVKKLFYKLAIKPGKPAWCGITREGAMLFALPGNPFSCLAGFVLLIQPWLRASFGLPLAAASGLPLRSARKKRTTLDEFFPVRIEGSPAMLESVTLNGSGDIRLGPGAHALALHPAESGDLSEGEIVRYYTL